jgi:phosphatidylserine decarboxylase
MQGRSFMFTTRTLLEGKWPLGVLAALAAATLVWCPVAWAPVFPLALLAFAISFFRDPEREVPADGKLIVAPAEGRIVEIKSVNEPHFLKGEATMVAIFLSVFDVHVQRAPIDGEIKLVKYHPGRFLDARHPQSSMVNENRVVGIESADGFRVTVRQIAGMIARRIVGWADPGATLVKGERLGMIRFGSRVELFLPLETEIMVQLGDHAKGGETIIARRK